MNTAEQNRANVRGRKFLKHYRATLLTQAGEPDTETVTQLMADISVYCVKNGIDLVDCIHKAVKMVNEEEVVERPKSQQPLVAPGA